MGLAHDAAYWLADLLSPLPPWLVVLLVSMFPVMELRGSIPLGIGILAMDWQTVLAISLIGNVAVVPLIWKVFEPAERIVRKWGWASNKLDRLYKHTRKRSRKRIETYEEIGLFLFVALPLPGTGAWTGALIAHLFNLPRAKSLAVISLGVLAAGILVTAAVVLGVGLAGWDPSH